MTTHAVFTSSRAYVRFVAPSFNIEVGFVVQVHSNAVLGVSRIVAGDIRFLKHLSDLLIFASMCVLLLQFLASLRFFLFV